MGGIYNGVMFNDVLNNGTWISNFEYSSGYILIEEKCLTGYIYRVENIDKNNYSPSTYIYEDKEKNEFFLFKVSEYLIIYLRNKKKVIKKITYNTLNDNVSICEFSDENISDEKILFLSQSQYIYYSKYDNKFNLVQISDEEKDRKLTYNSKNAIVDIKHNNEDIFLKEKNSNNKIIIKQLSYKHGSFREQIIDTSIDKININSKWTVNKYNLIIQLENSSIEIVCLDKQKVMTIENEKFKSVLDINTNSDNEYEVLLNICSWPNVNLGVLNTKNNELRLLDFRQTIHQVKGYREGHILIYSQLNSYPKLKIVTESPKLKSKEYETRDKMHFEVLYDNFRGKKIPSLLVKSSENKSNKLVVFLHGGPAGGNYNTWNPFAQLLLSRNFDLLLVNNLGSNIPTYGLPFIKLGEYGEKDLQNILNVVQKVKENYKDIFVYGNSYGGYLGVLLAKELSYIKKTVITSSFLDSRYLIEAENKMVKIFAKRAMKTGVLGDLEEIKTPTLIFNGSRDNRVPLDITRKTALENDSIYYEEFSNEGHVFRSIKNINYWITESLEFFEEEQKE
jgi:esterase/lipase